MASFQDTLKNFVNNLTINGVKRSLTQSDCFQLVTLLEGGNLDEMSLLLRENISRLCKDMSVCLKYDVGLRARAMKFVLTHRDEDDEDDEYEDEDDEDEE